MLKFFSRMEKTRNLVIIIFALVLIVGMVVSFAPTPTANQGNLTLSDEAVATVGGSTVTVGEVAIEEQNRAMYMRTRMPGQTRQILDSLIGSKLTNEEAARLGFYASDEELKNAILEQNKPADGKPFDLKKYEQQVTDAFGSVAKYEQKVREQIATSKLYAFLTSAVSVSEQEVLDDYKKQNTKFNVSYVPVGVTALADSIKPSEDELKTYFDQNKQAFYISVDQRKLKYIFLNQTKVGEKLQLTEEDMKAEYESMPAERKRAGVNVQQIVLKVANADADAEVLQKANGLVAQARAKNNGSITEEEFAEMARGNSQDPGTANNGGRLAGLVRENKNPSDPLQKTLSMMEGTVSEPEKFGNAYYIFRRGSEVAKTYEDAKPVIQVSLRNRKAYAATADLAQKVSDRLKEVKNVEQVAGEFAGQANMSVGEMVRETGFIKKDDDVPNIGVSPQFEEGIATLENPNDVGDKIPVRDGFAIPMLLEKKAPRDATYEEAKTAVTKAYKEAKAKEQIDQIAKDIASGATSITTLKSLASAKGLKSLDSKDYRSGSPLGEGAEAGASEELEKAIFALKAGEVTKTPVKIGDTWFIVGLNERLEADMTEFAKQRDSLIEQAVGMKRSQVFGDFVSEARRRYETEGRIRIYDAAVTKLENAPSLDEDA